MKNNPHIRSEYSKCSGDSVECSVHDGPIKLKGDYSSLAEMVGRWREIQLPVVEDETLYRGPRFLGLDEKKRGKRGDAARGDWLGRRQEAHTLPAIQVIQRYRITVAEPTMKLEDGSSSKRRILRAPPSTYEQRCVPTALAVKLIPSSVRAARILAERYQFPGAVDAARRANMLSFCSNYRRLNNAWISLTGDELHADGCSFHRNFEIKQAFNAWLGCFQCTRCSLP